MPSTIDTIEYEKYLRTEWLLFTDDPSRAQVIIDCLQDVSVSRVLDVGTGAGQELLPFVDRAFCVGVDSSPEVGRIGRDLFTAYKPKSVVAFARAVAENLPFKSNVFDIVICRLVLPYTNNSVALSEISRTLRPGGVLLLKIHHARYYARKLWRGVLAVNILSAVHASRVLLAGVIYHLTGKQVQLKLLSTETFQTRWLLTRELSRCRLAIERELPGSNPLTPFFLIRALT